MNTNTIPLISNGEILNIFKVEWSLLVLLPSTSVIVLNMVTVYLKVLSDNERAVRLYKELCFQEIQKMPLINQTEDGITKWVPNINQPFYAV